MDDVSAIFRISGPDLERDQFTVSRAAVFLGRAASNDIPLNQVQISRRHMRIFWQDGSFWIEDLGSANGVWLNDMRIEPHIPRKVSPGDQIRVGPFNITFAELVDLTAPPPPTPAPYARGNGDSRGLQEFSPAETMPANVPPPQPGLVEMAPAPVRQRVAGRQSGGPASLAEALVPRVRMRPSRYPNGIPLERSTWLQYLPGLYSDPALDPTHFIGRYLLIFETIMNPITWVIDNFDLYLSPETAPPEWLQWLASWFDVTILPQLPVERQRAILSQIGFLFLRRGTCLGLERLLELTFGVKPEITEDAGEPCQFHVRLALSQSDLKLDQDIVERMITAQKPAFTTFTLEIV
jgi:phage tail-like protein